VQLQACTRGAILLGIFSGQDLGRRIEGKSKRVERRREGGEGGVGGEGLVGACLERVNMPLQSTQRGEAAPNEPTLWGVCATFWCRFSSVAASDPECARVSEILFHKCEYTEIWAPASSGCRISDVATTPTSS